MALTELDLKEIEARYPRQDYYMEDREDIYNDIHMLLSELAEKQQRIDFEKRKVELSEKRYQMLMDSIASDKVETALSQITETMSRMYADLHGIRYRLDHPVSLGQDLP